MSERKHDYISHLESATANPIVFSFEEEKRGKRVYFAARWLNNTAQSEPWSDIKSAVITLEICE